jgi:hypothetical protein
MATGLRNKHFEDLYQKLMETENSEKEEIKSQIQTDDDVSVKNESDYLQKISNSSKKSLDSEISCSAEKIGITLEIISALLSSDTPLHGPHNFIYFNGYNSGISTFSKKTFDKNPFAKVSLQLTHSPSVSPSGLG